MRPDKDTYFVAMAKLVATRSTCLRRHVGCVLVDRHGHVLATGYNGVASGLPHCNEVTSVDNAEGAHRAVQTTVYHGNACSGALAPLGQPQSGGVGCEAIHAEQNALLQCRDAQAISTCYVTLAPCSTCTKLLMNTSCRRIVFMEEYVPEHMEIFNRLWAEKAGREWEYHPHAKVDY